MTILSFYVILIIIFAYIEKWNEEIIRYDIEVINVRVFYF